MGVKIHGEVLIQVSVNMKLMKTMNIVMITMMLFMIVPNALAVTEIPLVANTAYHITFDIDPNSSSGTLLLSFLGNLFNISNFTLTATSVPTPVPTPNPYIVSPGITPYYLVKVGTIPYYVELIKSGSGRIEEIIVYNEIVEFYVDGALYRTETTPRYCLFDGDVCAPSKLATEGDHKITAKIYDKYTGKLLDTQSMLITQ